MLKALAMGSDGKPTLVVGLTADMLRALAAGADVGFNLKEMGLPEVRLRLEVAHDDESLVRDWATRGILPPGVAAQIIERIGQARAGRESQSVWNAEDHGC